MFCEDVWKQVSVKTHTFHDARNPYVNLWVTYEFPDGYKVRGALFFPDKETADHIASEITESMKNKAKVETSPKCGAIMRR